MRKLTKILPFSRQSTKIIKRSSTILLACAFILSSLTPIPFAFGQINPLLNLPVPGTMVTPSQSFVPILLKSITIDPKNPLTIDFIIDSGNSTLNEEGLQNESQRLIKYFFASLTIPKNDLWVNLSPHEENRIITDELSKTELGRDMLGQDYLLKQLTASLLYPEKELGKEFWSRVYQRAREEFGTTEIPVETFNKVWIVPEIASIYENGQTAYIVESHLKVMLEKEYYGDTNQADFEILSLSEKLIKEIIIPEIEKEVNGGKNFARLRQIYHSLILAKWYKETIKESLLSQVYVNQKKISGISLDDNTIKEQVYERYMQAYQKGVYNYIKEDYDNYTQKTIPRKYFSGGLIGDVSIASSPVEKNILNNINIVGKDYRITVTSSPIQEDTPNTPSPNPTSKEFIKNLVNPFWRNAKSRYLEIKRFFADTDPHMIDRILYHPESIYGKWVNGFLDKPDLEGLGVDTIDKLWEDLIKKKYIEEDGTITEKFIALRNFTKMDLSIELYLPVQKAVFEEIKNSILTFTNSKGEEIRASIYHVRVANNTINGPAKGGIRWITAGDLVENEKFMQQLLNFNKLNPTRKEFEKFLQKWIIEESKALAAHMTHKPSGNDLPVGGGKGGVFIGNIMQDDSGNFFLQDYDDFNTPNLPKDHRFHKDTLINKAKIARLHSRDLARHKKIGIDIDIPAPDMRTGDGETITWYADEYLRYEIEQGENGDVYKENRPLFDRLKAKMDALGSNYDITKAEIVKEAYNFWIETKTPVPWLGVFTGKPPEFGGARGRAEATGFGIINVLERFFKNDKKIIKKQRMSIQGFGMVGKYTALGASLIGIKVAVISDLGITLINEAGWTPKELLRLINLTKKKITLSNKSWRDDKLNLEDNIKIITIDREKIRKAIEDNSDEELTVETVNQLIDTIIDIKDNTKTILQDALGENIENLTDMVKAIEKAKKDELVKVTDAAIGADVDILVSAVGEGVLNESNADTIKATLVVEGGNGSFTPGGERRYKKKSDENTVIPDTLANRGGVYVSYLETEQVKGTKQYKRAEILKRLKEYMSSSYDKVVATQKQGNETVSLRQAADIAADTHLIRKNYAELLKRFNGDFFQIRKEYARLGLDSSAKIETFINRIVASGLEPDIITALKKSFNEKELVFKKYLQQNLKENFDQTSSENFLNWLKENLANNTQLAQGFIDFSTLIAVTENKTEEEENLHYGYLSIEDAQAHRVQFVDRIKFSTDKENTDNRLLITPEFEETLKKLILSQKNTTPPSQDAVAASPLNEDLKQNEKVGGIDLNNITIDRQGNRVNVPYDPTIIEPLIKSGIIGFTPIITNFTPISHILPISKLEDSPNESQYNLSSATSQN